MKKIKKISQRYKIELGFIILAILPFSYYSYLWSPYNEFNYYSLSTLLGTWSSLANGSFFFGIYPVDIVVYFVSQILPIQFVITLYHIFFLSLAGIFCYKFLTKLIKHNFAAVIGGFFYIYSIYSQFSSYLAPVNMLLAVLPLISYRILLINKKTHTRKEAAIWSLLFIILIGQNLTYLFFFAFWVLFMMLIKLQLSGNRDSIQSVKVASTSLVFFIFISFFFYLTSFAQFFFQNNLVNGSLSLESSAWKSSSSYFQETIRQMGAVAYYYFTQKGGYAYPNAQPFITNPILIVISFIFPIIALLSIVLYNKKDKQFGLIVLHVGLLCLLFFMTWGVFGFSPTKDIYNFLLTHIPYFSIFRDSYKPMLLVNFVYAILISFTLKYLFIHFPKIAKKIAMITILCIIVISYQFWGGTFLKSFTINIPSYWHDFESYYRATGSKRTVMLPVLGFQVYNFTSHRGLNALFFRSYFNNNVIFQEGGSIYYDPFNRTFFAQVQNNPTCFIEQAGFLGISQALNQHDLDTDFYDSPDYHPLTAKQIDEILQNTPGISFKKTFSKLNLYTINPTLVYSDIYIPNKIISGTDICTALANGAGQNDVATIAGPLKGTISTGNVTFSHKKINDSIYLLDLTSHKKEKSLIVLNKRYDNGWMLFPFHPKKGNIALTFVSILSNFNKMTVGKHIIVNTFANGWWINPESVDTSYILVYMPELFFFAGSVVSLLALIIVVTLLITA